jgi:hypothetical protein
MVRAGTRSSCKDSGPASICWRRTRAGGKRRRLLPCAKRRANSRATLHSATRQNALPAAPQAPIAPLADGAPRSAQRRSHGQGEQRWHRDCAPPRTCPLMMRVGRQSTLTPLALIAAFRQARNDSAHATDARPGSSGRGGLGFALATGSVVFSVFRSRRGHAVKLLVYTTAGILAMPQAPELWGSPPESVG